MLCFSPVGTTLRVRSRKFPAVTNCTAIDWFHEWPAEALVSVSLRFLEDIEQVKVGSCKCYILFVFSFFLFFGGGGVGGGGGGLSCLIYGGGYFVIIIE